MNSSKSLNKFLNPNEKLFNLEGATRAVRQALFSALWICSIWICGVGGVVGIASAVHAAPETVFPVTVLPAASAGRPSAATALTADASLTVDASATAASSVLNGVRTYDLGRSSVLSSAPLQRTFTLKNASAAPLTVVRVQTSCGCTSAVLTKNGVQNIPAAVSAGGTVDLQISIDVSHLMPGVIHKTAWVYTEGGAAPLTLELTGILQPGASFSPEVLDFGRVPAGEAHPLRLTLRLDPRLAAQKSHLGGSDPNLQVKLVSELVSAAGDGGPGTVRVYEVSLASHPHLGILGSTLSLVPDQLQDSLQPFAGSDVPVTGEVVGEFAAAPSAVAFGMVTQGETATQAVTLSGKSLSAQGFKVVCASPYLSAQLLPGHVPHTLLLDVALSPAMPPGSLETQVIVIEKSGLMMVLPVTVYVSAAGRIRSTASRKQ